MTPTEIAQSLFFRLPVINEPPNREPIEYAFVKSIRYTHTKTGGSSVGLELEGYQKPNGSATFTIAYMRYCRLKNPCDKEPPEIKIPARIKSAFENYKPVSIKTENFSGDFEEITKIVIELDGKGKPVIWCVFENKYEIHQVPSKAVSVRAKKDCIDYQAVLKLFAKTCPTLPKPTRLTDSRRTAIRNAINDGVDLKELFQKVAASFFLTKRKSFGIDWVLKPANRLKILEGNYDNIMNINKGINDKPSFDIDELEKIQ